MRIAFINQPIGIIRVSKSDGTIHADSLGLWNCHVAAQCKQSQLATVLSRTDVSGMIQLPNGVRFEEVPHQKRDIGSSVLRKIDSLRSWIGSRKHNRPPFATRTAVREYGIKVADAVHKGAYDIVQVHNFAQLVPFILDKCPSVKVHLHMHCEWLSQLNTGLVEQGVAASTWLSGCSQFIADGIAHRFPNRSEDIFALLNGVDTNLFHPCAEEDHKSVDPVELLFVGRVSPEKGVHVLLHAFNKVVEIEANVRLKIIGARIGAPYDYIARLDSDKKVHELDRYFRDDRLYQSTLDQIPSQLARERIEFIPSVPQAELLNAYQSADVFIFPSVWQEPFGMPLIEAMACGKPVVTTNSGGIPEFVKAGINGLLVERGNAEELADAILSLISDPDTRRRMGIAGREFVERELDWSAVARRLLVQLGASQIPG